VRLLFFVIHCIHLINALDTKHIKFSNYFDSSSYLLRVEESTTRITGAVLSVLLTFCRQ